MGKNGRALREAKLDKVTYTFTSRQLQDHDETVLRAYRDRVAKECTAKLEAEYEERQKRAHEIIQQEWDEREAAFKTGDAADEMALLMQYVLSVPVRVLVERFGWTAASKDRYDRRLKITQFAEAIVDEVTKICDDDEQDIRSYCAETFDKYGIKFFTEER